MCRNLITVLRDTLLNLYVPFDSHIAFHKLVAYTALFFSGKFYLSVLRDLSKNITVGVEAIRFLLLIFWHLTPFLSQLAI